MGRPAWGLLGAWLGLLGASLVSKSSSVVKLFVFPGDQNRPPARFSQAPTRFPHVSIPFFRDFAQKMGVFGQIMTFFAQKLTFPRPTRNRETGKKIVRPTRKSKKCPFLRMKCIINRNPVVIATCPYRGPQGWCLLAQRTHYVGPKPGWASSACQMVTVPLSRNRNNHKWMFS